MSKLLNPLITEHGTCIRFYGTEDSILLWRRVVASAVGKEGTATRIHDGRSTFEVILTASDRAKLMQQWHSVSGMGQSAGGYELLWNDCVTFLEC